MRVWLSLSIVSSLLLLVALPAGGQRAQPQTDADKRELDARTSFARGDYKEALSLYVRLYAETLHPTYLRNIGRCYQNLREPAKAIDSFREYLRKARDLPPGKRAEIDGFIAEMEALERQQAAARGAPATAPNTAHAAREPAAPAPAAALPPALSASPPETSPGVDVAARPAPARPLHERWWFWTGVGSLALAVVIVAVTASGDRSPDKGIGMLDLRMDKR